MEHKKGELTFMQNEIKRTSFSWNIYGKEYSVNAPTMRQVNEFTKMVDKSPSEELALSIKFLSECGIPEEDAWEMEPTHLRTVLENLVGQKKS